jgi:hypothetical protein
MSENQLFQKLLPINISFVNGESPSPTKLTGIFNYIQASYFILESYLGNGIDYSVTTLKDRKMLFNLASSIGSSGNIYRPTNKLTSLYNIHKHFGAVNKDDGSTFTDGLHDEHTNYVYGDGVLGEYLEILEETYVPISYEDRTGAGHQFGITYKGKGSVTLFYGDGTSTEVVCSPPTLGELLEKKVGVTASFIDSILLSPHTDGTPLEIYSVWLTENTEAYLADDQNGAAIGEEFIYNVANAIPTDNGLSGNEAFWKIGPPCQYSLSTAETKCDKRTCGYCLGNTYDVFVDRTNVSPWQPAGQPVCGGSVGIGGSFSTQGEVDASLVPSNGFKYTPVIYTASSENVVYAVQSCLLMKSKPFLTKLRPFAANKNLASGIVLTKNESAIYDMGAIYNPIKYNITLRATGRPDIIYVHDVNKELVANSYNKINVIGGAYNITEMLYDILKILNEKQKPQVAVYAD